MVDAILSYYLIGTLTTYAICTVIDGHYYFFI